jgi:hypothetical protein
MDSLKKTARQAGLLYLILAILGFYGLMFVSRQLYVKGNPAATADNILANEFLFRTGIVSHLLSSVAFLLLAFFLYKLLKEVNQHWARIMVGLVAIQTPIVFVMEALKVSAIMTLKGEVLKTLATAEAQNLAFVFIKIHGYGIMTLEIFFGLWLFPFAMLVYKSGFMPKVLGVLLFLAGIGYTVDSLTFLLAPAFRPYTMIPAFTLSGLGEIGTILWLLIKGVKDIKTELVSSRPSFS